MTADCDEAGNSTTNINVPGVNSLTDSKLSPVALAICNVLHIRGLGSDSLVGYNPIAMTKNAIDLARTTEHYGASFFSNSAAGRSSIRARSRIPPHMIGDLEKSSFSNIEQ
ncbi:phage portal protein [Arcanobacterium phocae]|uniref:phage portal protein n=1 Tax=Arcanobacterium phocae TaxID=131112 RepID=UPI000A66BC4F|nr:phage portal protein [Arcanobacterium phocae]